MITFDFNPTYPIDVYIFHHDEHFFNKHYPHTNLILLIDSNDRNPYNMDEFDLEFMFWYKHNKYRCNNIKELKTILEIDEHAQKDVSYIKNGIAVDNLKLDVYNNKITIIK